MVALGDGSAFLFYFEKWTVGVSTSGRPVTFDTSLARTRKIKKRKNKTKVKRNEKS